MSAAYLVVQGHCVGPCGVFADGILRDSDFFYTELCNFLDYTASIIPVTTVDKVLDKRVAPHTFHNHEDEAVYKLCASPCPRSLPQPANNAHSLHRFSPVHR